MRRLTTLTLIGGILVGAAVSEGFHLLRGRHQRESFQRRVQCRNLAKIYAASNSDDNTSVLLDRVDFSSARNSCVVSLSEASFSLWHYEVVDIVTGDRLYLGTCNGKDPTSADFCGGGRDVHLMEQRDEVFNRVVK